MTIEHTIIPPNIFYIHKADHRDRSSLKSQWTIAEIDERNCCLFSIKNEWWDTGNPTTSWGVFLISGKAAYLGLAAGGSTSAAQELIIGKFLDSSKNGKWHGYPANHAQNTHDIPPTSVLREWLSQGYFSAAKVSKIVRGQPCRI